MSLVYVVIGLVAVQRLAELIYAQRNERHLRAQGGVEVGAGHYPLFVVLHAAWLAALLLTVPAEQPPDWFWLSVFAALQLGRLWVIASLGRFWTTRVITLPGAPLIRSGPYRWVKHPNYLIVAGEIAALPLAFDATRMALLFSILNALLLWHRIRVENEALAERATAPR